MKMFVLFLAIMLIGNAVYSNENLYNAIYNEDTIFYSPSEKKWSTQNLFEDNIKLKKTLIEGTGAHSIYKYEDNSLAFALSTDYEIVKNGNLVIVDNNLLKYYKIILNEDNYLQIPLEETEIKALFPDSEFFRLSQIESDNKIWIHKPFGKQKKLLLVNDTEKCFHGLTTKTKRVQNEEIKGLITISKYGIIRFKHFGERDGKLIFYIR